ncbi:MAG: tRNA (adenosine(37)-N6)-dimethylallyltransferase MiaA [Bryobacteraceae bacterium]
MQRPLLIVVGPTGTGKSSLALHLAEQFGGELVNADSVQLYRGFDIGSAKTPMAERRGIPHHLFDAQDAKTVPSAGDYGRAARKVVEEISGRSRLPIVVGGTGFYIRALLDGLPALPARNEAVRERLTAREPGSLHRLLSRLEPAAASRIQPEDTQKLIRALEIRLLTKAPLPPAGSGDPLTGFDVLQLGLDPPREALVQAITVRTKEIFAAGLLDEVRGLLASGLTGDEKPFESLGYKQAVAHLRGELEWEAAIESTEIGTRQYAKRQRTWFRRDARIHWLAGFGTDPGIQAEAVKLCRNRCNPSASC